MKEKGNQNISITPLNGATPCYESCTMDTQCYAVLTQPLL
jgi:hypothetical protein